MISPSQQKIIQIEITNACPHKCANCTRFAGHHKKPFFMTVSDFKKAVNSLRGYKGMIGVMGGEPTLHPAFDKIVKELRRLVPDRLPKDVKNEYITRFSDYRARHLSHIRNNSVGLWSSLGPGYYHHFELIQDTFDYQCINDHAHNGEHISLMLPRRELGINDDDWIQFRDNCWVQKEWSASITPKGAFFCEIAAALDMLFDGPGGWKVETGWWERTPNQFGDQLKWCELCSACLPVPRVKANTGIDVMSPWYLEELKRRGSRKVQDGKYEVFDARKYKAGGYAVNHSPEPYIPAEGNKVRVASTNTSIKPKSVDALIVCVGYDDYLDETLKFNMDQVDTMTVVTDSEDKRTPIICRKHGANCIVSSRIHENGAKFAKGKAINDALNIIRPTDWVLIMDADVILNPEFLENIKNAVLNPGNLYFTRRWGPATLDKIYPILRDLKVKKSWDTIFKTYSNKTRAKKEGRIGNDIEAFPYGYFQLFNVRASVLFKDAMYVENSGTAEHDDRDFGFLVYPERKRTQLPVPQYDVIHLPHGLFTENWEGRRSPRLEKVKADPKKYSSTKQIYRCIRSCLFRNRLFAPGDTILAGGPFIPKHFERVS